MKYHKTIVLAAMLLLALGINAVAQTTHTLTITIQDTEELTADEQLALAVEAIAYNCKWQETVPNPAEGEPGHDSEVEVGQPIPNPVTKEEFFQMKIRDFITDNIAAYNDRTAIQTARAKASEANKKLLPVKDKIKIKINKGVN